MKRLVVVLVLVAAMSAARADKKPQTAQALSGIGTGVSSALFLSAFLADSEHGNINMPLMFAGLGSSIVSPSLGQFYAGQYFTVGMGVRTGAALLGAYAVTTQLEDVRCLAPGVQTCKSLKGEGVALVGLAAIAFVGGAAYDVMDADDAVLRSNHRQTFYVTPTITPGGAALQLGGTF